MIDGIYDIFKEEKLPKQLLKFGKNLKSVFNMKKNIIVYIVLLIALSGFSVNKSLTTPENALHNYLTNNDKTFSWEIIERFKTEESDIAIIKLTSQEWRDLKWIHQLTIISPSEINTDGALLFITGGSLKEGEPKWKGKNDGLIKTMAGLAVKNKAIVAIISQVPNQPLYTDLTEDALISYTLHNFTSERDFTWPLLFPMTKSAIKAMDAVQQYAKEELNHEINRFVVTGESKRGWTTWLTGSQDPRVAAIAPMVIDVLNMPVNIDYQKKVWGDYSVEIGDYVKLGIAQNLSSPDGKDLTTMIDPYSYRVSLTMPKMIFMGTNDKYWPADAVKNYYFDIPGKNYIHYEPNVGHDIRNGAGTIKALSSFFNTVIYNHEHHACEWQVSYDASGTYLTVKASPELKNVTLWSCNSTDQDFRNDKYTSTDIQFDDPSEIVIKVDNPLSGFRAFYVDLTYPDPVEGTYSKTTRMFVEDSKELFLDKAQ
jgi:PhoPQ-activated pathogenicity-related protein